MMRFALLAHDFPTPHWDLLLEAGPACRTWRILTDPTQPGPYPAKPLPDHRLHYLTYEGPVSGDRGSVKRVDSGELIWLTNRPEVTRVLLYGECWQGVLEIRSKEDSLHAVAITPRNASFTE